VAKPKLRRWVCPKCGAGKRAPGKPRTNDSRTYCFVCSEKTGQLVRMTCPALDKEREKKAEASKAKAAKKREQERDQEAAKYTIGGVDLREELKRICRAPYFERRFRKGRKLKLPVLEIKKSNRLGTGCASGNVTRSSIKVRIHPEADAATARWIVLHLVCLIETWGHDEKFGRAMCFVAKDVYGVDAWKGAGEPTYKLDRRIEALFREGQGAVDWLDMLGEPVS